jgi:hypothetical protein
MPEVSGAMNGESGVFGSELGAVIRQQLCTLR